MSEKKNQSFWNEKWVPITFEGIENPPRYEVSNYGRLRSFQTGTRLSSSPTTIGTIIKGSVIQGYRSLNIRSDGKTLNRYVHKLVAEHFSDRKNIEQTYVIHLDHDKQNNYYQNLQWVTKNEMIEHNRNNPNLKNRPAPRPTRNYKLTESKVKIIKKLLRNDKNRLKMIAKQFGITHTQLNRIRSGENWKHVTIDGD
ncbi:MULTISPECIES: NUMOD4 domain-containing protein [Spirosoma]|uniref:NUMOD4 motif-containing HNH endonuclease n=1 Tax=Spirosoma liriopis TaxID=2937440 RepID=A0ABT0HHG3_9BACT|nr:MULTISPECIES: HNH endonuclease [Spirosoma]MCK8491030.1 NUMOD4 motif-containing HNH endonuclease [Spirosoma liriopis]UHG90414.1 NUMOD4 motif-containing HNH endonuclease [Spirosoma oryzicola]